MTEPSNPTSASKASTISTEKGAVLLSLKGGGKRYIVTAAHYLPHLPPPMTFSSEGEGTLYNLFGTIGEGDSVAAECLFVDAISDVAVLGGPDAQELTTEATDYEALVESVAALSIDSLPEDALAWPPVDGTPVWVLSLDCQPF